VVSALPVAGTRFEGVESGFSISDEGPVKVPAGDAVFGRGIGDGALAPDDAGGSDAILRHAFSM